MKKILLSSLLVFGLAVPGNAATYTDSVKEPHPETLSYVYDGFPIGTVMPMSQRMEDSESKGYLLCDGRTFSASKYPTLANALMVCKSCGNSLNGDTYCKYCKKKVDWKYAYNDDKNPQGSPKLPDLGGKFLRGFNQGTGYLAEGDSYNGLYSMKSNDYRSSHKSKAYGETQYSSAKGSAVNSDDGDMSFMTMMPLSENGSSLEYVSNSMNEAGNVSADMFKTEYIQSTVMNKAGNIMRIVSSFGFWAIPGLFQKSKTYQIGTPTKYKLDADIGDTATDTSGDYARPVNNSVYYYVRAW